MNAAGASASAVDGPFTFGWDVGGAHLKVSLAGAGGGVVDVAQWACPLWQGLDHLNRAIDLVFARWPAARARDAQHAVTMTGEMVDLFPSREDGVRILAAMLAERLPPRLSFYAGAYGWLTSAECEAGWRSVASANWLATASLIASSLPEAILIDVGSTTTDIVPIAEGRVVARAADDAGRLVTGELVYQGVVRTPLCALAQRVEFRGASVNVMNEWFATAADVYRLTGELNPAHDQHASADRGAKTEAASRVRLARMIGRDASDASDADWRAFAFGWRTLQLRETALNLARVEAGRPELADAPLIGAGCGRFLVAALAREQGRGYLDFAAIVGASASWADWAATCAPSVAVALLAARESVSGEDAPPARTA